MAFTIAVIFELVFVFSCRKDNKSALQMNPFSNPILVGAVVVSFIGQAFIIYNPFLQMIFKTVPLTLEDWAVITLLSLASMIVPHIDNLIKRIGKHAPGQKMTNERHQ